MASLRGRLPCIHTPVAVDTIIVIYRMKYRAKISVLKDAVQSKDSAPQCCSTEQRFHYAMLQYKARIPLLKAALQSKDSTLTVVLQRKYSATQCCTKQRFRSSMLQYRAKIPLLMLQYRAKIPLLKDAVQSKDSAPQGCST